MKILFEQLAQQIQLKKIYDLIQEMETAHFETLLCAAVAKELIELMLKEEWNS